MQWKDGRPWMQGVIAETNSTDTNGQSYVIRVTKIGKLITCNTRYICKTLIMAK